MASAGWTYVSISQGFGNNGKIIQLTRQDGCSDGRKWPIKAITIRLGTLPEEALIRTQSGLSVEARHSSCLISNSQGRTEETSVQVPVRAQCNNLVDVTSNWCHVERTCPNPTSWSQMAVFDSLIHWFILFCFMTVTWSTVLSHLICECAAFYTFKI